MNINSSQLYWVWKQMRYRCYRPSHKNFKSYGGRGLRVCKRWLGTNGSGFRNFISDMGKRPAGMTLERIDNNKGYSPDNCKWATRKEQSSNTRKTQKFRIDGVQMSAVDWAKKLNITPSTIHHRIKSGWSLKRALTTPRTP